ncbi:MAG: dihydroorotase [bacterium]|nr:dihydroorotase [bacterium]
MKLVIKKGRLIDPASGIDDIRDVLIEDGLIAGIASSIPVGESVEVLDADGLVITPGFIDIHVHLRDPGQEHKETIGSGAASAARGGFTSIVCMPNTLPGNDCRAVTEYITGKAKEEAIVNVFPVAAVSKGSLGKEMVDMADLCDAGVKGFSDDGWCVMDEDFFRRALECAGALGVPVIEHPEDHSLTDDAHLNEGAVSRLLCLKGMPAAAEDLIVERDIKLQDTVNGKLHLTHISTAGAFELIKKAKENNIAVTSDVTPHHLLLTEELIRVSKDPVYKMKPPLRSEQDRLAMIEGIKSGIIDCIATDHAPHSAEEKNLDFKAAPFGVIGMESSFPVVYDRLVRSGVIDMVRLVELYSTNPARVIGLTDRGRVEVGLPADLTVLNLDKEFTINAGEFASKSLNCPFTGWEGKGVVHCTIVNGKTVYRLKD